MSGTTLLLRVVPPVLRDARRPQRMIERALVVYKRTWMIIFSGFFEPLFYLLSIRIGLGDLVGDVSVGGKVVDYAEFVGPALLASSAMNGAVYDSTMNVFWKLKYARVYDAVLATPLGAGDVALGEIGWALLRGSLYATAFVVVLSAMGLASSPWIVMALPVAVLIGFAFGGVGMAATTYLRSWADFEYIPLATMPMFLFSGSFFPLSTYAEGVRWVVQATPLYHGVELVRMCSTGEWRVAAVAHVAYLLVMGCVGLAVAARRVERLLLT